MAILQDLTNFTSAGILESGSSEASVQQALCPSSQLPEEEWVCIEDYYSNEEESGIVEAAPTSSKDQLSVTASRSVCLALTDEAVELANPEAGLIVSPFLQHHQSRRQS